MNRAKVWFEKGLSFGCTQCGKCCKGQTNVFVNSSEVQAMASHLQLDAFDFVRKYAEDRTIDDETFTSIKNEKGACALLSGDGKTCSVYPARPVQCRTYPFWSSHVMGKTDWTSEATRCEGISLTSQRSSPQSPVIETTTPIEIAKQLIISQIHDRGVGENWTYEESRELLEDTHRGSPDDLIDFLDEFGTNYSSFVLHESKVLRVVDSTMPIDNDGAEVEEIKTKTVRRMEFIASPLFAQTEVIIADTGMVNHDVLCMPVHRTMATLALLTMRLLEEEETRKEPSRVAVLGAGGCAVPSYVYKKHTASKLACVIDAVEPNIEVLGLAERFFGVRFAASGGKGIVPQAMTGEKYVYDMCHKNGEKTVVKEPLDILLIDTCTNELERSLAPVPSMLGIEFWKNVSCCLKQDGIVGVNVLGDEDHANKVLSSIKCTADLSIPIVLKIKNCQNLLIVVRKQCDGEVGDSDVDNNKVENIVGLLELAGGIEEIIRSK